MINNNHLQPTALVNKGLTGLDKTQQQKRATKSKNSIAATKHGHVGPL